jgi:hypothetical protein
VSVIRGLLRDHVVFTKLLILLSALDKHEKVEDSLRTHFKTEKESLWPHYENFSRSLDVSIRRRLDQSVKALESDIAANGLSI